MSVFEPLVDTQGQLIRSSVVGRGNPPEGNQIASQVSNYDAGYVSDYSTGAQVQIFINNVWIEDIVAVRWSRNPNNDAFIPTYNYNSQYINGYMKGKHILTGSIAAYAVSADYLPRRIMATEKLLRTRPSLDLVTSRKLEFVDRIRQLRSSEDDANQAREYIDKVIGQHIEPENITGIFDLVVVMGNWRTGRIDIEPITNVKIQGDDGFVSTDDDPIVREYRFTGRDRMLRKPRQKVLPQADAPLPDVDRLDDLTTEVIQDIGARIDLFPNLETHMYDRSLQGDNRVTSLFDVAYTGMLNKNQKIFGYKYLLSEIDWWGSYDSTVPISIAAASDPARRIIDPTKLVNRAFYDVAQPENITINDHITYFRPDDNLGNIRAIAPVDYRQILIRDIGDGIPPKILPTNLFFYDDNQDRNITFHTLWTSQLSVDVGRLVVNEQRQNLQVGKVHDHIATRRLGTNSLTKVIDRRTLIGDRLMEVRGKGRTQAPQPVLDVYGESTTDLGHYYNETKFQFIDRLFEDISFKDEWVPIRQAFVGATTVPLCGPNTLLTSLPADWIRIMEANSRVGGCVCFRMLGWKKLIDDETDPEQLLLRYLNKKASSGIAEVRISDIWLGSYVRLQKVRTNRIPDGEVDYSPDETGSDIEPERLYRSFVINYDFTPDNLQDIITETGPFRDIVFLTEPGMTESELSNILFENGTYPTLRESILSGNRLPVMSGIANIRRHYINSGRFEPIELSDVAQVIRKRFFFTSRTELVNNIPRFEVDPSPTSRSVKIFYTGGVVDTIRFSLPINEDPLIDPLATLLQDVLANSNDLTGASDNVKAFYTIGSNQSYIESVTRYIPEEDGSVLSISINKREIGRVVSRSRGISEWTELIESKLVTTETIIDIPTIRGEFNQSSGGFGFDVTSQVKIVNDGPKAEEIGNLSEMHVFLIVESYDYQVAESRGTVDATVGAGTIVGRATHWNQQLVGGSMFLDGKNYIVQSVQDRYNLTLTEPFTGRDEFTNKNYIITNSVFNEQNSVLTRPGTDNSVLWFRYFAFVQRNIIYQLNCDPEPDHVEMCNVAAFFSEIYSWLDFTKLIDMIYQSMTTDVRQLLDERYSDISPSQEGRPGNYRSIIAQIIEPVIASRIQSEAAGFSILNNTTQSGRLNTVFNIKQNLLMPSPVTVVENFASDEEIAEERARANRVTFYEVD